ncbi:chromosomal replication initiator DnaA [Celeribacter sp.]|uniref:chromosomal replication initiator DnaA n=1 Tax=Celeribacter sp. TaxID=1890673 RepID=UPI003A94B473
MPHQLTFDLPTREALGRDAFFVAPSNRLAVATLENVAMWPSGKLALIGPKGSGKTHLAHVWAIEQNAVIVPASALTTVNVPAIAAQRHVVVEDADTLPTLPDAAAAQEALFHLHNLTLAEGGRLLITATHAPNHWALTLPDLASRMEGTAVARIEEPDDALLSAMLIKHFEDHQIAVSHTLIPYLVKRIERSAAAVRDIVDALDAASLRSRKPVSQKLAAQVLDKSGN